MRQVQEVTRRGEIPMVQAESNMDKATFAAHMTHRHPENLGGATRLPANIDFEVEQSYRAFHRRLHGLNTPAYIGHDHEPESLEKAIDFALDCICENRDWGWKEIAGVTGLFAAYPDGRIATRVEGRVKFHEDISDATDRLLSATEAVRMRAKG